MTLILPFLRLVLTLVKKQNVSLTFNQKKKKSLQEVAQSARTTPNEVEITILNPPPPSCVDMSKKKKKKSLTLVSKLLLMTFNIHLIQFYVSWTKFHLNRFEGNFCHLNKINICSYKYI
jgi:hypothetical protein